MLVGFTWLALLPWINVNVWRFMFWAIDVASWMAVGSEPPFEAVPPANATTQTGEAERMAKVGRTRNNRSAFQGSLVHTPLTIEAANKVVRGFVKKLANDCFQGQILSCVIVVFFVGVFLLREWILQNIPQNFDVDVAQPAPVAQQRDAREQMIEDLNRQRQQFEELLARAQAEAGQAPAQQQREAEAEEGEGERGEQELELDPEVQREQARQARIRRLEQMFGGAAAAAAAAGEQTMHDRDDYGAEGLAADEGAEASGSRNEAIPTAPENQNQKVQRLLQDVLGWSERLDAEDEHDDDGGQAEVDPDSSSSSALDRKTTALDVAASAQEAEQHNGPSSSSQAEHVALTSEAAPQQTPLDAPTETDHTNVGVQADQPLPTPPAQAATETADEEDAWEDESDPDADPAPHNDAVLAFPPPIAHAPADHDEIIEINAADAGANPNADPNDPDAEVGLAEEMDGILEAIGMRGPIFGIVQNLFLMIFLCGFVMLAFVMAPYVVGKALGSGPGLVRLVAMPVKVLRYVTDPVFDGVIALGANKVWPKVAGMVGWEKQDREVVQVAAAAAHDGAWKNVLPSMLVKSRTREAVASAGAKGGAVASMLVRLLPTSVTASSQWKAVSDSFDVALSAGFQGTLLKLLDSVTDFFARLDAHRQGTSTTDRIFCVAFGHFYWLLLLFVYQHFSKPDLQRAMAQDSALKLYIDQHVLILKALSFIFIELVVFPLGCGLLFDICTMPFLAEASIFAWPEKIRTAPLSFAFTRWMGGTIYMFVFAQYVSTTRRVLRPGVLCWIRDPNDPNFHPIKEILNKKSWTQLSKIGASAVMYAAILVASVGVNTYAMRYLLGGLGWLPLRWKPWGVGMEVPVDLVVVHFVVPWAAQKMDPEKIAEGVLNGWWEAMARGFRLSSYLVEGEFADERRVRKVGWVGRVKDAWGRVVNWDGKRKVEGEGEEWVEDGGLCRVPADDKAITTGPLIIDLDQDGNPKTEKMAEAITKQEKDAEKHTPKPTYTNICLPSHYRVRITAVLTLLWLSHSALFILGIGVPLSLGRGVTRVFRGKERAKEVHDFYSYSFGFTLLLITYRLVRGARKMWIRRERRARTHGTTPAVYIAIHLMVKVKRVFKAFFLLLGVMGVVPLIVGLLIDQYVVVPLRYKSTQLPVLALGQIWALGIIEFRLVVWFIGKVLVRDQQTGELARFMSLLKYIIAGGLYPRPRVVAAWKWLVLPIAAVGAVLLLGPIGIAHFLASRGWVEVGNREEEQLLLRKVYGAVQSMVVLAVARVGVKKRMDTWTEVLKDEVFLESTELKNYEVEAGVEGKKVGKMKEKEIGDGVEGGVEGVEGRRDDEYMAEGTLPDVLFR